MRRVVVTIAALLVLIAMIMIGSPRAATTKQDCIQEIKAVKHNTQWLNKMMGQHPYRVSRSHVKSCNKYSRWIALLWRGRFTRAAHLWFNPPHKAQWLCIHRYEGSWTDPNSPYYGGLQMDVEFQQTYGKTLYDLKGTADHWTPLEQMWVAEHAYKTRGFWPWPNTARWCGLL